MKGHSQPSSKKTPCLRDKPSSNCHAHSSQATADGECQHQESSINAASNTPVPASTLPPPIKPSGLVSPTAEAFEQLSVDKQKQKQKRRQGIYGLKELLEDNAADESQLPHNSENENKSEDEDKADGEDGGDEDTPDTPHRPLASSELKRKREVSSSPPSLALLPGLQPYTRTNNEDFNIFAAFLQHPELCLYLATRMPVDDLISLYAISRDFHKIVDQRFTTVILSIARRRAPESYKAFPFRCYRHLCRIDPAGRLPHPDPRKAAKNMPRMVPGFRWLKMIMYREAVVHEIMVLMAEDGVPMPRRCGLAMKKMWFMMDVPDTARRVGLIHSRHMFSDLDLYFMVCTIVKMDMRFNDPIGEEKHDGMRHLLLAQASLTPWLRVLKGEIWTTKLDILRAWIRWRFQPPPMPPLPPRLMAVHSQVFGVTFAECGRLQHQHWGTLPPTHPLARQLDYQGRVILLLRPDQLVLREVIRRGLRLRGNILRFVLYGYIDLRSLRNMMPRNMTRCIPAWDGVEYRVDGLWGSGVGAVTGGQRQAQSNHGKSSGAATTATTNTTAATTTTTTKTVQEAEDGVGTDELLDLGPAKEVSEWCIARPDMGPTEKKARKDLEAMNSMMKHLWKEAEEEE